MFSFHTPWPASDLKPLIWHLHVFIPPLLAQTTVPAQIIQFAKILIFYNHYSKLPRFFYPRAKKI